MIATNNYINRWKTVAQDLEDHAYKGIGSVTIHLFTNEIIAARDFAKNNLKRINLMVHEVKAWGWPEATLLRYEFFSEASDQLNSDFLVYLDSDMRVVDDFGAITKQLLSGKGIGVVRHPGYFILNKWKRIKEYISTPSLAISDIKLGLRNSGSLGAWETNKLSRAFVPRSLRRTYVHGAIWFGYRDDFLRLCKTLAENTRIDLEKGVIAKWHDESHLNSFITKNRHKIFDNRLSFVFGYSQLEEYSNDYFISNVTKNPGEGRIPSNA